MNTGWNAIARLHAGSPLRNLAALGVCAMLAGGAAALERPAPCALPELRTEARLAARGGKPLVVLFSLPDCPYCVVVRNHYLMPLTRAPREADRLPVRELTLTGSAPLAGFRGEPSSAGALAAHYGLRVAPAVVVLDGNGALLAPPLIGGDVAGMYGAYLDRMLDEARARLAAQAAPHPSSNPTFRKIRLEKQP